MPPKRRRAPAKAKPRKKVKTTVARVPPKPCRGLSTEIVIKIFKRLDIITATVFSLANHQFNDIYHDCYEQISVDAIGTPYPRPLPLHFTLPADEGYSLHLTPMIARWMPKHLVYDYITKKFVGPLGMQASLNKMLALAKFGPEEQDERRDEKEQYRRTRFNNFLGRQAEKQEREMERAAEKASSYEFRLNYKIQELKEERKEKKIARRRAEKENRRLSRERMARKTLSRKAGITGNMKRSRDGDGNEADDEHSDGEDTSSQSDVEENDLDDSQDMNIEEELGPEGLAEESSDPEDVSSSDISLPEVTTEEETPDTASESELEPEWASTDSHFSDFN